MLLWGVFNIAGEFIANNKKETCSMSTNRIFYSENISAMKANMNYK